MKKMEHKCEQKHGVLKTKYNIERKSLKVTIELVKQQINLGSSTVFEEKVIVVSIDDGALKTVSKTLEKYIEQIVVAIRTENVL